VFNCTAHCSVREDIQIGNIYQKLNKDIGFYKYYYNILTHWVLLQYNQGHACALHKARNVICY
jgi:hypothetical protein